jgi:predicted nucleic acid-binding protein
MSIETAFWDTSAILPLCCSQIFTVQSKKFYRKFPKTVIWWGTSVEINSGLARLKRNNHLDEKEVIKSLKLWEKFRINSRVVLPIEKIILLAEDLPERYELRAMDSFQMAAALVWCQEKPRNRPFVTADDKLSKAVEKAGFTPIFLS